MYARKWMWLLGLTSLLLTSSCKESKSDYFKREAQLYTERYCPNRFDDGITVLDSMVYDDSQKVGRLKVYYTLELDSAMRAELMKKVDDLWQENLKYVANTVVFAKHKSEGISFSFIYFDKETGRQLFENEITKRHYER